MQTKFKPKATDGMDTPEKLMYATNGTSFSINLADDTMKPDDNKSSS